MTDERTGSAQLRADAHPECQDLLPWLVNGTLATNDRARMEQHLAECDDCRADLAREQDLHQRMSADDRVAYSPAASFEKLWSRIEELEREVPATTAGSDPRPAPVPDRRWRPRHGSTSTLSRWLAAAVVVQAIALGWLTAHLAVRDATAPWVYRTVTTPTAADPTLPRFRVVFASQATVTEQQDVLVRRGLVIVGGPSLSGVYVLAPAEPSAIMDAELLLADLRAEDSVRYAELAR
jgi:anti-sigma factor RsiW